MEINSSNSYITEMSDENEMGFIFLKGRGSLGMWDGEMGHGLMKQTKPSVKKLAPRPRSPICPL